MKNFTPIIIISSLFLAFTACNDELEVNAEWENIPVVYTLLNQNDTVHYIKVNKAFLGDATAQSMAAESDSLFYDHATVYVNQMMNGNIVKRLDFVEVDTIPKPEETEEGEINFASDRNTMYVYVGEIEATNNAGDNYKYELNVDVPGKDEKCTSEIELISGASIKNPSSFRQIAMDRFDTGKVSADYITGENGNLYQMIFKFYYLEVNESGDTVKNLEPIKIEWPVNEYSDPGQELPLSFSVDKFVEKLIEQVPEKEGVTRLVRYPNSVSFTLYAADEYFRIYSEINAPSDGVVQEKPFFTNINNGIGLFAARFTQTKYNAVTTATINELSTNDATSHLNFANQNNPYYQSQR